MISQMYGWMGGRIDAFMDNVRLRYSICDKLDVWMEGKC